MLYAPDQYRLMREAFRYCDRLSEFEILPTQSLDRQFAGKYRGIFAKSVPAHCQSGINLRRFESLVRAIFEDVDIAEKSASVTDSHINNLKTVVCAVVHWKMASQGGRARKNSENVKNKWRRETAGQLINAYRKKEMPLFEIGGVRIPTATTFMRLLFPEKYGIMDSRVVKITQREGVTRLNIRPVDGYIIDCRNNREQYTQRYVPFLTNEAQPLTQIGITFEDIDEKGDLTRYTFRPCDIEMALFAGSATKNAISELEGEKGERFAGLEEVMADLRDNN